MKGFSGIKDVDKIILSQLEDKELLITCNLDKYFRKLCDEKFWRKRYGERFENIPRLYKENDITWKSHYLNTIIALDEFSSYPFTFFDLLSLDMKKLDESYFNTYYTYFQKLFLAPNKILINFYFLNLGEKVNIYFNDINNIEQHRIYYSLTPYKLYKNLVKESIDDELNLVGFTGYKDGYKAMFVRM